MTIDISKIQVGDTVTLGPFEVTRRDATSGYVSVWIGGGNCAFNDDHIATHTPKPRELKVGDWVTASSTTQGLIVGIDEHLAWINWGGGSRTVRRLLDLTLADPAQ